MSSDAEAKETAWLTAQVPKDLSDALKRLAEQRDRSVSAEVRQAIRAHVDAEDSEPTAGAAA